MAPFERKLMGLDRHDLRVRYSEGYSASFHALRSRFDCDPQRVVINQTAKLFLHLIASVVEIPIENFVLTGDETGHVGTAEIVIGLDTVLKGDGVTEPHLIAGSTPYAFGSGLMVPA